MKAQEFCYWLQGYFEISGVHPDTLLPKEMNCLQVKTVQQHLALVFQHEIDPQYGNANTQQILQAIHDGKPSIGPNGESITYRC